MILKIDLKKQKTKYYFNIFLNKKIFFKKTFIVFLKILLVPAF